MATGAHGGGWQWAIIGSVIVVLLTLGGVYLYSNRKATKPLAEVSSLETWLTYNAYDVFKPLRDDMPPGTLIKLNGAETVLVMTSAELFGENATTTSRSTAPDVSWKTDQKLAGEGCLKMVPGLASAGLSNSGVAVSSVELKNIETETIPLDAVKAAVNDNEKLKDALIKSDQTMLVVVEAIRAGEVECNLTATDGGTINAERVKAAVGSNFEVTSDGKIVSSKPLYLGFKGVKRAQGSARPGSPVREIRIENVPLGSVRRYRQQSDAKSDAKGAGRR
ncbi:MAG: hypothetical protein ACLQIB_11955 [Isosphaeraceae bacterium]